MDLYPHILGCLLGTAVGDAAGLRREGLTPRRARRLYGDSVSPGLLWGRGLCSDDTEHAVMVARALALADRDLVQFERRLAGELRHWVATVPAGVGWATLRACLKLLLGFGPQRSGVYSAGNGPAMRAAILGICATSDEERRGLVHRSTRLTHTDPKAEEGAAVVAWAASLAVNGESETSAEFLRHAMDVVRGDELRMRLENAAQELAAGRTPAEYVKMQGWTRGVSGYVNETVPAALYCWAASPSNFRQSVVNAVLLGGDTDTVGAITGAISGANLGYAAIPSEWIAKLAEWPRTVAWMEKLAATLAENLCGQQLQSPPPMRWPATLIRNLAFASIVLGMGFRRLLPPY